MKRKDPTAMITDPVATHDALLYLPPIKLINKTTMRAPMSCELGIIADLVDGTLNCLSIDGRAAFAIPLTA